MTTYKMGAKRSNARGSTVSGMNTPGDAWSLIQAALTHHTNLAPRQVEESVLLSAEQALGVDLPPTYRKLIGIYGHLELGAWELFGLGSGTPRHLDLVQNNVYERQHAHLPTELLCIANDGGSALICLSTTGKEEVIAWDLTTFVADKIPYSRGLTHFMQQLAEEA